MIRKKVRLPKNLAGSINSAFKRGLGFTYQSVTIEEIGDDSVMIGIYDPVLDYEDANGNLINELDILSVLTQQMSKYFKDAKMIGFYSKNLLSEVGAKDTTPAMYFELSRETQF